MQSFGELSRRRRWMLFVDAVVVAWLVLFVVDVGATYEVWNVGEATLSTVRLVLSVMLVVFLVDVLLLYRWSDDSPRAFLRKNWFYVLTVIPWFRPFRLRLRGRGRGRPVGRVLG